MALLNWLDTADAKALAMPLTEKTGGFTSDPVDALYKLAWHEGWHMGQVATLRRALGLKSIFG